MGAHDYEVALCGQDLNRQLDDLLVSAGAGMVQRGRVRIPGALNVLAEKAADAVNTAYHRASQAMGNDEPDVEVKAVRTDTGAEIVASGDDTFFLEFGIGKDTAAGEGPFAKESGVPVEEGSWSREHDGPYSKQGYWFYSKKVENRKHKFHRVTKKYTGVQGSHAMYQALKDIEESAVKVMKQEMRKYW